MFPPYNNSTFITLLLWVINILSRILLFPVLSAIKSITLIYLLVFAFLIALIDSNSFLLSSLIDGVGLLQHSIGSGLLLACPLI